MMTSMRYELLMWTSEKREANVRAMRWLDAITQQEEKTENR